MKVLEVGSGASGFQFVLANLGLDVTSVDPLINPSDSVEWTFQPEDLRRMARAFNAKIHFIHDFLENTKIASESMDRVFSISAIEHVPESGVKPLLAEVHRILKPNGFFVATIDLFLDCHPFTSQTSNMYGSNATISSMLEGLEFEMVKGDCRFLYGFPEFSVDQIQANLGEFLCVNDVLIQCVVLRKLSR